MSLQFDFMGASDTPQYYNSHLCFHKCGFGCRCSGVTEDNEATDLSGQLVWQHLLPHTTLRAHDVLELPREELVCLGAARAKG
jgi:hypothetical protein